MTLSIITASEEKLVNTNTSFTQDSPAITVLADGGWVVAWAGTNADVYQQHYDAQGNPVGGETRINVTTADTQLAPALTALADGGWIATWQSRNQDGSGYGVYQQRFNADGVPQFLDASNNPQDLRVNTTTSGEQLTPSVTALPLNPDGSGGGWVVSWQGPGSSGQEIFQQRYDQDGAPVGGETQVNTFIVNSQQSPNITTLADGGWVVIWQDGDIKQQRYDENGAALGGEVTVYSSESTVFYGVVPKAASLAGGGWVVTWEVLNDRDGWGDGIYQQQFGATGDPIGAMTLVSATIAGDQRSPSVTGLADGGWVVTWESEKQDGSGFGIYQQRYSMDGMRVGGEVLVTTTTLGDQVAPQVTALPDGSWLVAYSSYNPATASPDVFVRHFTPASGEALSSDSDLVTGSAASETLLVTQATLNAGDRIDGGGGTDTLSMSAAGTLDLTVPAALSGFEVVRGTAGNDTILTNAERLADVAVIDGRGGTNVLQLSGNAFDLSNKTFLNVGVKLTDAAGTDVTLNDKAVASLLDGTAGAADGVILVGDAFTVRERGVLFQHGIETVTDSSGTYTNAGPTDLGLSGGTVLELSSAGTPAGTLQAQDPNSWDEFTYTLLDDSGGRFALSGDKIVVKNGLLLDYEQASSYQVKVRVTDAGGQSFDKDLTITIGNRSTEVTAGSFAADTFVGGSGNDHFGGAAGNDILMGGNGNDTLSGGTGKDTLTGGSGKDFFLFDVTPNKLYPDVITDFSSRYDTFQLKRAVFKGVPKGALASQAFVLGKAAKDADDRIIYDKGTGNLYYDADGTGHIAAVKIATLTNKAALSYHDFIGI